MNLENLLEEKKAVIEKALDYFLPSEEEYPQSIHRAMRYSIFAGGKRIRPVLVLQTAELFTPHWKKAIPPACALELIHTYSLIHDDLPAMDDDDFRRGRPTSHKVFGEGLAVLAGDALLTLAFEILAGTTDKEGEYISAYWQDVAPELKLQLLFEIARASGIRGMISGQVVDLESEGKNIELETLEYIDNHKTGALLAASIRLGALLGKAETHELEKLTNYAYLMGKAFQIVDDILDVEGNEEKIGKATGMDAKKGKSTYISLFGMDRAKKERERLFEMCLQELEYFGPRANVLREITRFIFYRDH